NTEDMQCRKYEARAFLEKDRAYMDELGQTADRLTNTTVSQDKLREILDEMFPTNEDSTDRERQSIQKLKNEYMVCYFAPDILRFRGTAWGAVNAMSDMISHNAPRRKTANYRENNWGRIMDGHVMLDKFVSLVA